MIGYHAVLEKLQELGSTSDEVADKLTEMGIKGTHCKDRCPIANYLGVIGVLNPSVCITIASGLFADGSRAMITPPGVQDFVKDFDNERFPELEERE